MYCFRDWKRGFAAASALLLFAAPGGAQEPTTGQILDQGFYESIDGKTYRFTKILSSQGEETTIYQRDGQTLQTHELRQYEESLVISPIDDALRAKLVQAAPGTNFELVVWLKDRPGPQIANRLRAERQPRLDAISEQIQAVYALSLPAESFDPHEEDALRTEAGSGMPEPSEEQKRRITELAQQYEHESLLLRAEINTQVIDAVRDDQARFADEVLRMQGQVRGSMLMDNALQITLAAELALDLDDHPQVARVILEPNMQPELDLHRHSLGLEFGSGFWVSGIEGGIWDVGVLDTGVQQDHPSLDHLQFLSNAGTTDNDGHGTGVAGIIASDHVTYRGMSYDPDRMLVGSFGGIMGHAAWMVDTAADDPEAINLSGGTTQADDTDYSVFDQFWDGLIDDQRVLIGKSAGNNGDGVTTISHPGSAYNVMTVANMRDFNTITRTDDVITSSSSRGPTLSGRRKPDISAPGHQSRTTNNNWAGANPDFVDLNGTSAAAPHVTGAALLLTDLRGNDEPLASKATLINTADAWTDGGTTGNTNDDGAVSGSAWNPVYGWGYLDLWEAWFNGQDVFVDLVDDGVTPAGPDFRLYRGTMYSNEKATLVWNRHVGYNGSNNPSQVDSLSDLDLRAYSETTGSQLDSSLSVQDNVEQVAVGSGGPVVLKVEVWGQLDSDLTVERYALATEENFSRADPPSFDFTVNNVYMPSFIPIVLTATVHNNGDVPSFNNHVYIDLPPGFFLVGGAQNQNVGTITAGGSAVAVWTIQWICNPFQAAVVPITNTSLSYGEVFSDQRNHVMICLP